MIRQQFLGQRLPSAKCAAEVEAARNLGSMAAYFCGAQSYWSCTRARGHTGVHVAAGNRLYDGRTTPMILERWADT